jgi:hypothetical protein
LISNHLIFKNVVKTSTVDSIKLDFIEK